MYDSRHEGLMMMQVSVIESMRDYETEFTDLYSSFILHYSRYKNSCELLLGPLILSGSKLRELLESGYGNAWQDEEFCEGLRKRLGCGFCAYKLNVEKLDRKVVRFSKKLGLGENMAVRI